MHREGRRLSRAASALACALVSLGVCAGPAAADPPQNPLIAVDGKSDQFKPKPPGTTEAQKLYFGPYLVPPGHDANRVDLHLPVQNGFILSVEPGMRRVADLTEPSHQEGHIHHAHWFALDPGNPEDNYTGGNTEWIFGNGDEETKADFQERTAADPNGPVYGQYVGLAAPQLMIYMLHNKTSEPLNVWIVLDVTFKHGTKEELEKITGRPHHDITGVLFGRTFDVPKEPLGDGIHESTKDHKSPIEWVSTVDGTLIGTGGHLHPGGLRVVAENLGSKQNPCPNDGKGYGGTQLYTGDALFASNALFSEDFQMEVTHPAWRAPIRKGDRIRITGVYENKEHGWYDVMTHEGLYVDTAQPPRPGCKPYLVGGVQERKVVTKVKRKRHIHRRNGKRIVHIHRVRTRVVTGIDPTEGVPNRPFGHHPDSLCGAAFNRPPCDRPERNVPTRAADTVTIANFLYMPGDLSLSGALGARPTVKKGKRLTFVNVDQAAGIRHSVTTCRWPCNGPYVGNYPLPDGLWDSETLGYDFIDGGETNPVARTPDNLDVGKYAYYCRIHPWMRGAFEVTP